MQSATQFVWELAGRPTVPYESVDCNCQCLVCGMPIVDGNRSHDVIGASFASHDTLSSPSSEYVCHACTWSLIGRPPNTIRMWSIVARTDIEAPPNTSPKAPDLGRFIHVTSRANLYWAIETLLDPPSSDWVVSVATSGQKHVLPFARVNNCDNWNVRFETINISSNPINLAIYIYICGQLLHLGFWTSDIFNGEPTLSNLHKCGYSAWKKADAFLRDIYNSPLLEMVLFSMNKETTNAITHRAKQELERRCAYDVGSQFHTGNLTISKP